jgi:hypothetical protein
LAAVAAEVCRDMSASRMVVWSIRAPNCEQQESRQPDNFLGQKSNPHRLVPQTLTILCKGGIHAHFLSVSRKTSVFSFFDGNARRPMRFSPSGKFAVPPKM